MGMLIGQLGAGGLLSLGVWLILTGRLVPRSTLLDAWRQRDTWQEAHRQSEEARHGDRDQIRQLLEVARVTEHVMTSLPQPGEVDRGTRVDEAAPR
ncbi:hypothetical protein ACFZAM_31160 [Streptomyces sp. NPDC008079]|uniref:hypothetical protein n=1 Tax=Streptomyces sp. NPDC008079 TaxID=3364806 RepID=UPI0036DFB1BF